MNAKSMNKAVGKFGEDAACRYLEKLGWQILARNYRYSRYAEIDIVAKDNGTIVFVEVKARSTTDFGHPFEAVNYKKLQNIFKAGLAYLKGSSESYKRYRIDIISVLGKSGTKTEPKIEHLKDVSLN